MNCKNQLYTNCVSKVHMHVKHDNTRESWIRSDWRYTTYSGDFNVPNIDWVSVAPTSSTRPAELLCTIKADNSLTQLVDCPTCDCDILDQVLTNIGCVSLVNVTDNLPSNDHSATEFSLSVTIPIQIPLSKNFIQL